MKAKLVLLASLFAPIVASAQATYPTQIRTHKQPSVATPGAHPKSAIGCPNAANPFTNCGFESGDFTGWSVTDLSSPFFAATVGAAGVTPGFGLFTSAPTEGGFAALHGFDGNGPGTIEIAQDVTLPVGTKAITFDYRAGWDMLNFAGSTMNRTFMVQIQPVGGGAASQSVTVLTAPFGTNVPDTGALTGKANVSGIGGQAVRVAFVWNVPQNFTGPAFFQLDGVGVETAVSVPALSPISIVSLLLLLMGSSLLILRRRTA